MEITRLTTVGFLTDNLSDSDKKILEQLIAKAELAITRRNIISKMNALQEQLNNLDNNMYITPNFDSFEQSSFSEYDNMTVGEIAKTFLYKVFEDNKLSNDEIELLKTKEYSKKTFDINFPLLNENRFDSHNRARYYARPIIINGVKLYICSQWLKQNREQLITWLIKHF